MLGNLFLKLKKYWPLLILGLILIIVFFLPKKTAVVNPTPEITTQPKPAPKEILPSAESGYPSPTSISWQLGAINLPEKIETLTIAEPSNNPNYYQKIAQSLELNPQSKTIPNVPLLIFNKDDGSADLSIDLTRHLLNYKLNLSLRPIVTSPRQDPQILTDKLINFLRENLLFPESFSLSKAEIGFETIETEWFVTALPKDAKIYSLSLNYLYHDFPIFYKGLPAVLARYSVSGQLVSLETVLPVSSIQINKMETLKTLTEIQKLDSSQFEILKLSGNRAFDLSDQTTPLKNIVIRDLTLGYLYQPEINQLTPYFTFSGTARSDTFGSVKVTLGLPALTSAAYYE